MFLADPQSNGQIHNLQNDQRANNRERPCNRNPHQLIKYLMEISLDHSGRRYVPLSVLKDWVHGTRRENPSENCAESTTRSMNTECVKRVVVAEAGFYPRNHVVAKAARKEANEQRRHRTYEACGRSDRHQTSNRAGDGP